MSGLQQYLNFQNNGFKILKFNFKLFSFASDLLATSMLGKKISYAGFVIFLILASVSVFITIYQLWPIESTSVQGTWETCSSFFLGGLFSGDTSASVLNLYGVLTVSALSGLFSDRATLKLEEIYESIFKPKDDRSDKLKNKEVD